MLIMARFTKYELSEDYWAFKPNDEVDLSTLEALDYNPWSEEKNRIQFLIDVTDGSDQPTRAQITTFDYILANQFALIQCIFDYYKKVILPVFAAATDIEERDIATSPTELHRVIGLRYIEIPAFAEDDGFHYFGMGFRFRHDIEHGLCIIFKNDQVIDFDGEGDKDYDAITIFNKGLANRDGSPLKIGVYGLRGDQIFEGRYMFDEVIPHRLQKGTYRTFYSVNQSERCRNFYIPEDLERFTFRQLITY